LDGSSVSLYSLSLVERERREREAERIFNVARTEKLLRCDM
jgi:hypothetical protein